MLAQITPHHTLQKNSHDTAAEDHDDHDSTTTQALSLSSLPGLHAANDDNHGVDKATASRDNGQWTTKATGPRCRRENTTSKNSASRPEEAAKVVPMTIKLVGGLDKHDHVEAPSSDVTNITLRHSILHNSTKVQSSASLNHRDIPSVDTCGCPRTATIYFGVP
jgi:hypothetical protein